MDEEKKNGPGAPKGNKNRVKDESGEVARASIIMRVPRSKKSAFVKAAQKEGLNLTDFICSHIEAHIKENHKNIWL